MRLNATTHSYVYNCVLNDKTIARVSVQGASRCIYWWKRFQMRFKRLKLETRFMFEMHLNDSISPIASRCIFQTRLNALSSYFWLQTHINASIDAFKRAKPAFGIHMGGLILYGPSGKFKKFYNMTFSREMLPRQQLRGMWIRTHYRCRLV